MQHLLAQMTIAEYLKRYDNDKQAAYEVIQYMKRKCSRDRSMERTLDNKAQWYSSRSGLLLHRMNFLWGSPRS